MDIIKKAKEDIRRRALERFLESRGMSEEDVSSLSIDEMESVCSRIRSIEKEESKIFESLGVDDKTSDTFLLRLTDGMMKNGTYLKNPENPEKDEKDETVDAECREVREELVDAVKDLRPYGDEKNFGEKGEPEKFVDREFSGSDMIDAAEGFIRRPDGDGVSEDFVDNEEESEVEKRFEPDEDKGPGFVCPECGRVFRRDRGFRVHVGRKHKESKEKILSDTGEYFVEGDEGFFCRECGRKFGTWRGLREHIANEH